MLPPKSKANTIIILYDLLIHFNLFFLSSFFPSFLLRARFLPFYALRNVFYIKNKQKIETDLVTRVQWPPVAPPDDDSAEAADKVAEQATALAEEHPPGPVDVVEPQGAPPLVRQLEMAPAADCSAAAAGHEMMIGNRQPSINNNNNPTPSTLPPDAGFGGGAGPSPISSGKGSATSGMSAPRRGRGVLNNVGVGPGARIPVCASCSSQIRYDPSVHSGSNFFIIFCFVFKFQGQVCDGHGPDVVSQPLFVRHAAVPARAARRRIRRRAEETLLRGLFRDSPGAHLLPMLQTCQRGTKSDPIIT